MHHYCKLVNDNKIQKLYSNKIKQNKKSMEKFVKTKEISKYTNNVGPKNVKLFSVTYVEIMQVSNYENEKYYKFVD